MASTLLSPCHRTFTKKDAVNAANAAKNPGSFETKTQIPPEDGYDFSYHNLVCPLSNFARANGYEEYMPYLCNLDYVIKIDSREAAQNAPSPVTNFTLFKDGQFKTHEILSEKKLLSLCK